MARTISHTNTYMDKLVKLIPAEWVSAYVALKGILDSAPGAPHLVYYATVVLLLLLLPLYLRRVMGVESVGQILATMVSFVIWVFSLGGEYVGALPWYEPYQGSIVLILWTLAIPVLMGQRGGAAGARRHGPAST